MKRFLALTIVAVLLLSLAACGGSSAKPDQDGAYYFGSEEGIEKLKSSIHPLLPVNAYSNITFNEKMFYGRFLVANQDSYIKDYAKSATFADLEYSDTVSFYSAQENLLTKTLSSLPVEISAGPASSNFAIKLRGEHEWAELSFITPEGYTIKVLCTYTVSGNTVSFFPLDAYEEVRDENNQTQQILYTPGTEPLEYTFSFSGTSLTLTQNNESVTLICAPFSGNWDSSLYFGGYLAVDSPAFENMDHFSLTMYKDGDTFAYTVDRDGVNYFEHPDKFSARLTTDGQLSMYWVTTDGEGNETEHLKHFVYFPGNGNCCTLYDGETVYYYTESSTSQGTVGLGMGMDEYEQALLQQLNEQQLEALLKKKESLMDALAEAFQAAGLNVQVNRITGEVALDSTVLFAVSESAISADGEAFLQKFMQTYTSVIFGDEYDGFVSRIIVEGHTDSSGTAQINQPLSQARAESVMAYCLSDECGIDADLLQTLTDSMSAVGYADTMPVLGDDGKEDMNASRRVSFRFIVNIPEAE